MVARTIAVSCIAVLLSACSLPTYYGDYDSRFEWRNEFHFLTQSDRSPVLGNNYSFVVVSDTHIGSADSADKFAALRNKLIGSDKFVVVTGDITGDGTSAQLGLFMNAAATLGIPCYPVIGNHDIYENRGAPWRELIGSTVYRIDSSDTSLFFLDNANASFGYDQIQWLEDGIRTAKKNTFVFAHENFFINGSPPDFEHTTDIRERAKIMSLLKNRCRILFTGHLHKRVVKESGGVSYISLENYGSSEATGVFCRVNVSGNTVSWGFRE